MCRFLRSLRQRRSAKPNLKPQTSKTVRLGGHGLEDRLAPAVFNIANGDIAAFIAAINTSNTNNEADTINLASGGTYNFTAAAETADGTNALPSIKPDTAAANSITINGNGSILSRVSGSPEFRFFRVIGSVVPGVLILNNATLSGGDVSPSGFRGGAVYVANGNLTLNGVTMTNNRADDGGAVGTFSSSGTLTITNCTISNNLAVNGSGGGVVSQGIANVTISGTTITNNTAPTAAGVSNQAAGGTLTITNCNISNNAATGSTGGVGGIFCQANLVMSGTSVDRNTAIGPTGGIFVQGDMTGTNSSITNNKSDLTTGTGGGIFIQGNLQLTNVTVAKNRSGAGGGGIDVTPGAGTNLLRFCTITGNNGGNFTFAKGGGLYIGTGTSTLRIANSIVAGNFFEAGASNANGPDVYGTINSMGYNLIGNGSYASITGILTGNLVGTAASPINPDLGTLQNNGGTTLTCVPNANSVVINAGDPAFSPPPATDQRGTGFPRVVGPRVDMGAVEAPPPSADLLVTKTDGRNFLPKGGTTVYTIVVSNAGPTNVTGATFVDNKPAAAASFTWTSVSAGGAGGSTGSGSGNISESLTLPAGGTVTYTVTLVLNATFTGNLTNTATITPPSGINDPTPANNTATDTDVVSANLPYLATSAGEGGSPIVQVYNLQTNALVTSFLAFDGAFTGGVRVAMGDFNDDGIVDYVCGAGPTGGPHVVVISGADLQPLASFFPYDINFKGGVFVAVGDVTGDRRPDIITAAGAGGGPHVRVFDGLTFQQVPGPIGSFFAYGASFRGGVHVAAGDTNNNGFADVITGPGAGGGPHVRVFEGNTGANIANYIPYDPAFTGGVFVGAGDFTGDRWADVVCGPGNGGGPHGVIIDSRRGVNLINFNLFNPGAAGTPIAGNGLWIYGGRVAAIDIDGDGYLDVAASPNAGISPRTSLINFGTLTPTAGPTPFDPLFLGGVFVAT